MSTMSIQLYALLNQSVANQQTVMTTVQRPLNGLSYNHYVCTYNVQYTRYMDVYHVQCTSYTK